jgi:putative ABC transport system permease protein
VGRRVKLGPPDSEQPWRQVVGVTADARYRRVTGDPVDTPDDPDVFFPLEGVARNSLAVSVRSALAPAALAPMLRRTVQRLAPEVAVFGLETPAERLARQRTEPRFTAVMMGLFAALALALAAVGVYGVMAYSVAERTQEIGVRMALGAREGSVLGMVVRQGMTPVALGLVAGLGLALALARLLASLLYEVRATEPAVYVTVSLTLLAVALAACLLPARRASRVDPMIALRHD